MEFLRFLSMSVEEFQLLLICNMLEWHVGFSTCDTTTVGPTSWSESYAMHGTTHTHAPTVTASSMPRARPPQHLILEASIRDQSRRCCATAIGFADLIVAALRKCEYQKHTWSFGNTCLLSVKMTSEIFRNNQDLWSIIRTKSSSKYTAEFSEFYFMTMAYCPRAAVSLRPPDEWWVMTKGQPPENSYFWWPPDQLTG